MKTFLLTLATTTLTLVLATSSQAAPKSGGTKGNNSHSGTSGQAHKGDPGRFRDYHLTHGTRFDHGYFYRGRNHDHWGQIRFDSRYGCSCYWDPCLSRWYYWCERDICFYPVSYCPYGAYAAPPVVEVARPIAEVVPPVRTRNDSTNVNVNVNNSAGALPVSPVLPIPEPVLPRR